MGAFFIEFIDKMWYYISMHLVSQSPQDTQDIAATVAQRILAHMPGQARATVVALRGELGAGKTTFTQGLARALGIAETPKSPTFNLVKQYAIPNTRYVLWHLDCYRLTDHRDLIALDLPAAFTDPRNIILIEWPERISDGLPRDHIEIRLTHEGPTKRGITITE
jgi:tRNA threonylcarbamoyladenosine biosynthesis protein TsaE